jgi:PPM family protein phosphatase
MPFTCELAARTDVGVVRSNNEDTFLCDAEHNLFAIFDGMGGAEAGEVASQLAAEVFDGVVRRGLADDVGDFPAGISDAGTLLVAAARAANIAIYTAAQQSLDRRGMGTTASVVLIRDGVATIAHVGDSRVYLVRKGDIQQLTRDHSVVAEQIRAGVILPENARHSPMQHYLTRALGPHSEVEPEVTEIFVEDDDLLLLATDGLVDTLDDAQILTTMAGAPTLEQCTAMLIEAAKRTGSTDNITCVLVKVCAASQPAERDESGAIGAEAH